MPVTPGNGIAAAAAAVASHRADDPSETTKRSSNIHGRTRGDEETLVKSSNDRKLALHIGCVSNAKEYSCCCLPIISLLRMALAHVHTHVYNHLRESHTYVNPGLTRFNSHQNVGWFQSGFNSSKKISVQTRVTRVEPEFNPGSSTVEVRMCLKVLNVIDKFSVVAIF